MTKPEIVRDLATAILDEMKGINIVCMDVHTLTTMMDYMIICTGRSSRQLKAMADEVATQAKHRHISTVRTEGNPESEWIIVDLGDVVVHLMTATTRQFYSLEDLWEPVKELREQKQ